MVSVENLTSPQKCRFTKAGPGLVVCSVCGRAVPTSDPPERVHAVCSIPKARPDILKKFSSQGAGSELKAILSSIGINPANCKCNRIAAEMDRCSFQELMLRRDEFVGELREAYLKSSWLQRITAAGLALKTGLAFQINWIDPLPDLVDEAIKRSQKRFE